MPPPAAATADASSLPHADIVVAGGGAVACAAALAADAAGLSVRQLLWAGAQPAAPASTNNADDNGRHYALSRRSAAFLQTLGLSHAALSLLPVHDFILHAGGRATRLHDSRAPLCLMATEQNLQTALAARLHQSQVAQTAFHTLAVDNTTNDTLRYTLDAAGAADNSPRHGHCQLLAAADGAASPVANQLGLYGARRNFHQTGLVATLESRAAAAAAAQQWFADNDIIALLPIGAGRFSLVWSTNSATAPTNPADIQQTLRRRTALPDLHVHPNSIRAFPLAAAARAARVARRAALLGDAACTLHPLAGQGLNLGLGDAETLIHCLRRPLQNAAPPPAIARALAAYSRRRALRAAQLQTLTQFLLPKQSRAAALLAAARLPLARRAAIAFANA